MSLPTGAELVIEIILGTKILSEWFPARKPVSAHSLLLSLALRLQEQDLRLGGCKEL